ncbi:hypothetical protein [Amycolatopsis sp. NPDC059657]|uniref:hypothetical protein n=1 Tax=Amycolatopsis sp. NPDC059657 TaxID=3346899 RepID=UPI00366AD449
MSAPQPPNQPWGGGQPQQGPPSGPQPQQDNPFGSPEPTQVVQPGQPQGGGTFGDSPEPTQVVQPQRPGDAGATQVVNPVGDPNATQMVNPVGGGGDAPGESTQLVPPGSQPPAAIPYAPPPSAADNPSAGAYGGYGQNPGAFGGQQQGFPPPQQQGFDPSQGQGGFGQPQQGFGGPPPGFGPPPGGAAGGQNALFGMIAAGVVALLGLIGAILMFTVMGDIPESPSDQAVEACKAMSERAGVSASKCDGGGSGRAWLYVIVLTLGSLAAIGGGVLLFLKNKLASWVIVGSAGVLLLFSIIFLADLGDVTRVVMTLIFGLLIGAVGALGLIPATQQFVGIGSGSALGGAPGGFGGPPSGGFGQPGQFGQPPQQQFGQPGGFNPPSGGFGQPGGHNPASGGFQQPQYGQPQQQPGQFGQPGQQPGQFGQQPYGQPQQQPGQPGQPGQFGQQGQPGQYGQPGQQPQQPGQFGQPPQQW